MRRRPVTALLLAAAALLALTVLPVGARRSADATAAAARIANAAPHADRDKQVSSPDELIVRFDSTADAGTRSRARGSVNARLKRELPVARMQLLDLPAGSAPGDAATRLEHQPGVAYAEPNFSRHALGSVDDPLFPYEWGLHNTGQAINGSAGTPDADIDAPEAWDVTSGDPAVTVGVVDTGIDATHPDLRSKINGGYDFVDGDNDPTDMNGHGTHVSGTIAAAGNDGSGVAGVAYSARLMPLRVLDASGSGSVADVVSAYGYAASHGIRVVNASLGSDSYSRAERDAIAAAPNTLFIVAAGNGGSDGIGDNVDQAPEYPCAYPLDNIVCVAATDSADRLAPFSNFGTTGVDIAAPGVDIASDWPAALGGSYAWSDGTSMASPHVAGAAALVAGRFASARAAEIRAALLDGADRPAALAGKVAGGRRLNAYGAVTTPAPAPAPPTSTAPATAAEPAPASSSPAPVAPAPDAPTGITAPQPAPAPIIDTSPPIVSVKVARRARSKTLRRGLPVLVSCSEACRIDTRLLLRRRSHSSRWASASRRLASAGRTKITVRPSRSVLRSWSRLARPGTRLRLQLTVSDSARNTRTIVKTVVVAR
jgi:subtilisin family serine protease